MSGGLFLFHGFGGSTSALVVAPGKGSAGVDLPIGILRWVNTVTQTDYFFSTLYVAIQMSFVFLASL